MIIARSVTIAAGMVTPKENAASQAVGLTGCRTAWAAKALAKAAAKEKEAAKETAAKEKATAKARKEKERAQEKEADRSAGIVALRVMCKLIVLIAKAEEKRCMVLKKVGRTRIGTEITYMLTFNDMPKTSYLRLTSLPKLMTT